MLSLELLDKNIAECAEYVKAGKENQSTLDNLLSLREDLKNRSEADWLAYNELVEHLPPDDADPLLIILKGHLLIEKLIRKFICSRLLNPEPFEKRGFGVAQCIAIAESMCLKNDDPAWLRSCRIRWVQNAKGEVGSALDKGHFAYRDRDTPHKVPLPHHAAYGSVMRGSADQSESDPGEHKKNGVKSIKKWGHYVATLVMLQVLEILPFKYQKYIFFAYNSSSYYIL